MKILMLRHAATQGNLERRYIGFTDELLCDEGIEKAESLGCYEEVESVFTSPMTRCVQTADILFPNARKIVIDGLREMNFGDFDGKSFADLEHDDRYREWVEGNCLGQCPNGEDKTASVDRALKGFKSLLLDIQHRHDDKPVIVITHCGVIMSIFSTYVSFNCDEDYFDWYVYNCEGYFFEASIDSNGEPEISQVEKITDLACLDRYYA